jgi:abortive infection bacteriophage resistance protein
MSFTRPALPLPELVQHLHAIGLEGDPEVVTQRLQDVGYHRLKPYWRAFRADPGSKEPTLKAGTHIREVWQLYTFDRQLRLLVLDATERVEVAVRARLVQAHVMAQGPFGYAEAALRPSSQEDPRGHYVKLLDTQRDALQRAINNPRDRHLSEDLRHFAALYGAAHAYPPFWTAAETFSFGDLVTLLRHSPRAVREQVAADFGVSEVVLVSWMRALQSVRNICAHHGRLWNRVLGVRPAVPDKDRRWKDGQIGPNNRVFFTLTILTHLLGVVSDGSRWPHRVRRLLQERYPRVPRQPLGAQEGCWDTELWAPRLQSTA